jgi:hypothetical protein
MITHISRYEKESWQTCLTSDGKKVTTYFGVCPTCHKTDGYINIGRGHWFYCKEHSVTWLIGSNLFSSWRDQTEEQQREVYDQLGFEQFTEVESWTDSRWRAPLLD